MTPRRCAYPNCDRFCNSAGYCPKHARVVRGLANMSDAERGARLREDQQQRDPLFRSDEETR